MKKSFLKANHFASKMFLEGLHPKMSIKMKLRIITKV